MAKSTRQEVREDPINIRREPLRTSNKPNGRRRVARRRDDTPTKEIQMQASDDEQEERDELPPVTADEGDDDNDTFRRLSGDDGDDDDDEEPGMPTKRAKLRDGQSSRAKSEKPPVLLPATKVFERDTDGFVPGSIVRIQLENFLTYDFVCIRPGARMNMILGPNGTGKSSIACALCVGLGFPVSILGRAQDINLFVRIGCNEGYVEVEVKGKIGGRNLVIRRCITSRNKTSTWYVDGRSSGQKKVEEAVAALNVQINNLCSFLPQDRVNEFAKLKPDELLRETQRVAGHPMLNEWHDLLKNMSAELKTLNGRLAEEEKQCQEEQEKNARLEKDVSLFQKRKKLDDDLKLYRVLLPEYQYKNDFAALGPARALAKAKGQAMAAADEGDRPIIELKQEFETKIKKQNRELSALEEKHDEKKHDMEKLGKDCKKIARETEKIAEKRATLQTDGKKRTQVIRALERDIEKLEERLKEPIEEVDPAPHQREVTALRKQHADLKAQHDKLELGADRQTTELAQKESDVRDIDHELRKLDTVTEQRFEVLNRLPGGERDTCDAIRWIRENRDMFQHPILEPACISVTVQRGYGSGVEECFNLGQLKTFVCQTAEDYTTLNRLLCDTTEGTGRRLRIQTWFRPIQHMPEPSYTREQCQAVGFHGFALDYVNAPEPMKWFLTRELGLHRIPIVTSNDAGRVDLERAKEFLAPAHRQPPTRYILGSISGALKRSEYGQRQLTNVTKEYRPGKFFSGQSVDQGRKIQLLENKDMATMELKAMQRELLDTQTRSNALAGQMKEVENGMQELRVKLQKIGKQKSDRQKNEAELKSKIRKLGEYKNEPSTEEQEMELCRELSEHSVRRLKLSKQYMEVMGEVVPILQAMTKRRINIEQYQANLWHLEELHTRYSARHRRLQDEYREANGRFLALRAELKQRQNELATIHSRMDDELRERHDAWIHDREHKAEGVDTEELEREITTLQTKLNSAHNVNPAIIQQYERRRENILTLSKRIQEEGRKNEKLTRKMTNIREQWYPELKALVDRVNERFSAAFERIHCAGEVHIEEHEDYAQWSIQILVKFRSSEELQRLTGQRQSGGERSLTTILFLMSLSGLAKTPFALVDEINQGMDIKYERAVHNELIQVTCAEDSGQYFLITPKLLPNLTYHENVTVLVINNGDGLPEGRNVKGKVQNYGNLHANLNAFKSWVASRGG